MKPPDRLPAVTRKFVSPIAILTARRPTHFTNDPPLFAFRYIKSGIAGTAKVTAHIFQLSYKEKTWEVQFCWRPDVTHHYWIREPFYQRTGKSWFTRKEMR